MTLFKCRLQVDLHSGFGKVNMNVKKDLFEIIGIFAFSTYQVFVAGIKTKVGAIKKPSAMGNMSIETFADESQLVVFEKKLVRILRRVNTVCTFDNFAPSRF